MNKGEFVREVAERTGTTVGTAEEFVYAAIDIIQRELRDGNSVEFSGFGKFYVRTRAEREGRNPGTGEAITIPETNVPVFKPGKLLKDAVM